MVASAFNDCLILLMTFSTLIYRFYAAEITLALQFLHKKGVVYRYVIPFPQVPQISYTNVKPLGCRKVIIYENAMLFSIGMYSFILF